jgi:ferredoxin
MKVHVDATACSGFGACAETCPSVFEIDEFGFAAVKPEHGLVPEGDVEAARAAVGRCPENAISAEE